MVAPVLAAVVALCLGAGGCGGDLSDSAVVVRVGGVAFTKADVEHWTRVIERGGAFAGFRGKPDGTPRQRALALLISSTWLIGQAAAMGIPVPESAVEEAIEERRREGSGFEARLRATGETLAGAKLEARAEIAGESIREVLAARAGEFTQRDIVAFYRRNAALFAVPEERVVDVVEGLSSAAAAGALVRRVGAGSRFAELAHREIVTRGAGVRRSPEEARFLDAVFATSAGAAGSPVRWRRSWAAFVVREVVPARARPFAQVRAEATSALDTRRQRALAVRFDAEYRARWGRKTWCRAGYVAAGCPQDHALLGAYEDPFSLRAHPVLQEQGTTG